MSGTVCGKIYEFQKKDWKFKFKLEVGECVHVQG